MLFVVGKDKNGYYLRYKVNLAIVLIDKIDTTPSFITGENDTIKIPTPP